MIEPSIKAAIDSLFGNRVYPDTASQGAARPFCTFIQVGGVPSNTFCGNTDKQNGRFQFNVWCDTREQASTLMRSIETIVTDIPFQAVSQGGLVAEYDEATRSYGARQDFSFWF